MAKIRRPALLSWFAGGALISALLATVLFTDRGGAQVSVEPTHSSGQSEIFTPLANLDEAAKVAGYQPKTVQWIPDGYERGAIFVRPTGTGSSQRVMQFWHDPQSGVGIILLEDPELDGLVGSHEVNVRGGTGQRVDSPSIPERPFEMVDIYWKEGGSGYVLTVITDSVTDTTEATIKQVIDSIR